MTTMSERVALVTGAGRGIGAEIAARFAREGARVAVLDLDPESAERSADTINRAGGRALGLGADVSSADQVAAAVQRTIDEFGGLQVLVNNAGNLRNNLLSKMTEHDWDSVIEVHLKGAFLCSREAVPHMRAAGHGRIISISSTAALGNRGQANYSAAKAGLQGFTRTLALELGPQGVTVNAIAPGFVESEMSRRVADRAGVAYEAMRSQVAANVPTRRSGTPSDIANAAAFFAGDEAGFVTGQTLYVDGGLTLPRL